ncbi:MAG TPA: hypothetical protein VGF99_00490 [Myxococcota bacterium]
MNDSKNVVSNDVGERLQQELEAGERVAWSAQPSPALYGRQLKAFGVIGVIAAAMAMCWIAIGTMAAGVVFGLFGAPFLLVAVVFASLPLRMRERAGRTMYAITDRRAIVVAPDGKQWRVDSYVADDLRSCTRVVDATGGGDLVFRERITGSRSTVEKIGFLGIDDVGRAEQVLERELLSRAA